MATLTILNSREVRWKHFLFSTIRKCFSMPMVRFRQSGFPFRTSCPLRKISRKGEKREGGKREPPSWTHAPSHLNRYTTCTVYASVVPFCSEGHQHIQQPEYQMWAHWVFKPFECISRQPFLVALLCPGEPKSLKLKVISYNWRELKFLYRKPTVFKRCLFSMSTSLDLYYIPFLTQCSFQKKHASVATDNLTSIQHADWT